MLKDVNGKKFKEGQVIEIKGGYYKNSNGVFKITNMYDSGKSFAMIRRNKNGQPSRAKDRLQIYPLGGGSMSITKQREASAHNKKNLTLEIIEDDVTEQEKELKEKAISKGINKLEKADGQFIYGDYENILNELEFYGINKKESIEIIKNGYENLDSTKQKRQKEREEYKKQQEEYKKQAEKDELEFQKLIEKTKDIPNHIQIKKLDKTHTVQGVKFAKLNKNNSLKTYQEEVNKGEYNINTVKIHRVIKFNNKKAYNQFTKSLLMDFDFLKESGGIDQDNNIRGILIILNDENKFIVNTEGFNYARYVGLIDISLEPLMKKLNFTPVEETKNQTSKTTKTIKDTGLKNDNKEYTKDEIWQLLTKSKIETKKQPKKITKTEIPEIRYNKAKNGIELKFKNKPSRETLDDLKDNGFRWSRYQKIWYTRDTPKSREYVTKFKNLEYQGV